MPVIVNAARVGSVEIVAEPRDEIAEVWSNTVALGAVAFSVNVAVIGILYVLFGRVLDPAADDEGSIAIKAFNDRVIADERVISVLLTVRDGVTLIRKA